MKSAVKLGGCCTTGYLHDGNPTGEMVSFDGTQVYCKLPNDKSTKHAVLIFSDVMGHTFQNNQLLADNFAANGFFAVMPDLFAGDAVPLNRSDKFDILEWLKNHLPEHIEPIVWKVMRALKNRYRCEFIAGAGYCYGAKYVLRFLKRNILDIGFVAHPSEIDREEILGIERPLSLAAGASDVQFSIQKRQEIELALEKTNRPYQITVYSKVGHGFAVRCDVANAECRFAKEQAFSQAVQWFLMGRAQNKK
ncbi:putative Dienelactone hydrolase family protein [Seiridium unicorne]|uniref:Dienelactone hydrolase family protein n=1 Tax=Seiridium unicorne TaxID=138068 RepID=A0ABR2UVE9_9PEZI